MNKAKQTVSLCMIVKDEAHVLARCLSSVRSVIDSWLIVDTGSTDGTQDLVRRLLGDLPGELVERRWKNFGHNRSESIELARAWADYLLIIDADEILEVPNEFEWPHLNRDAYSLPMQSGGVTYTRVQLVRSGLPWRYEGVVHEYITCGRDHTQETLLTIRTVRFLEGARSRDPLTYHRDAQLLEEALALEPSNARNVFYLAQSYRDAKRPELAIERYRERAGMGGFPEEIWCALYEIGRLMEQQQAAWPETEEAYLNAYRYRPWRAEPLYRIGLHYQSKQMFAEARPFLAQAMQIPLPIQELLFVHSDLYAYFLPLEFSVNCFWLDLHEEAIAVIDRLLAWGSLEGNRRKHLLHNRRCSAIALANKRSKQ